MEKPDSNSGPGGSTVYNTVFIDTSLDTHLAVNVSGFDTVSDLKKKILYEHPLFFPKIGEIKINALKVKRKGYLYHLSDSVFVKSAFDGSKSWFLSVDASSAEEHSENHNSHKADASNVVACIGNNSSADVVDDPPLADDPSKRPHNINELFLQQDGGSDNAKLNTASQQLGLCNSFKENSEDLHMEGEHMDESNSKVLFPAIKKRSRLKVQEKDVRDNKISEDLPASITSSVLKEKHKTKKRKKDAMHDRAVKESGALVVESSKDALELDNANERNVDLNDIKLGNQICVDETCRTESVDRNKRSASSTGMADGKAFVLGEHAECELNTHKDGSLDEKEYRLTENPTQSGLASGKKHRTEKKDGNKNSLFEDEGLVSELVQDTPLNLTTTKHLLGQKLESKSATADHLNTESVKDNGRKSRKRQKSNPSHVGSEISFAKDVNLYTYQAIEAINDKDLDTEADPGVVSKPILEPRLISSNEIKEVSKINGLPNSEGTNDMADGDDGNMKGKNEAPAPDVASVMTIGDSVDQNVSLVDGHVTPVSQVETNLQDGFQVSGHQNHSELLLEDKIVEPKKSSKKIKRSKKTKDPVEETSALGAENDIVPETGAPETYTESVIKARDSTDLNASHGDDHPFLLSQEGANLRSGVGVSKMENQNVKLSLEDKTVEPKKSSKKIKKPNKIEVPAERTEPLDTESNRGPTSTTASVFKTRDSVDRNASNVDSHPTLVSQEGINLQDDIGVSGQESKIGVLKTKIVEPQNSSRIRKKSKKTKDPVGGTEASDGGQDRGLANVTSEQLTSMTGDHLLNNAAQDNTSDGNEASKKKILDFLPSAADMNADDVIQGVLESLHQCNKEPANAENMDKKSKKKSKKKNPAIVEEPLVLKRKDDIDHQGPTVWADNVSEVSASSKSTRKTKVVKTNAAAQLNGSDCGSKIKTGAVSSQLDSSLTRSTPVVDANNSTEVPLQSEGMKDHHHRNIVGSGEMLVDKMTGKNEEEAELKVKKKPGVQSENIVDSGKMLADKVTDKGVEAEVKVKNKPDVQSENIVDSGKMLADKVTEKGVEAEVKVKKKPDVQSENIVGSSKIRLEVTDKGVETAVKVRKKKPDVQSGGLPTSQILSGNQNKNAKSKAAKSSSIQSQRSSSKAEPYSSNVESSKTLLTISESAAKESLQSNKSSKINSKPKDALRPVDINSSMLRTNVQKNNAHAASSSILEKSDKGKVVNSLQNKSLLSKAGTIFKHDDMESSDDENGVDNSDDSTRAPSESSSSEDSEVNAYSSRNGSYDSEAEGGGRNLKTPGYSKPKGMSLDAILRNSSSYKKAKLTASQSQADDSLPEVVPDSQAM